MSALIQRLNLATKYGGRTKLTIVRRLGNAPWEESKIRCIGFFLQTCQLYQHEDCPNAILILGFEFCSTEQIARAANLSDNQFALETREVDLQALLSPLP